MDETEELQPTEIREYEGEKLSSVNAFRENSIKGPQHIDIESYRLKISGLVYRLLPFPSNEPAVGGGPGLTLMPAAPE